MPAPEFLVVSEDIWNATAILLRPYAEEGIEAGLFWFGIRNTESAAVSAIGIPRQTNRERNFEVIADDLAVLVRRLGRPLVIVAQLHTHPGTLTEHSSWDDDLVVSLKILSLVLPDYGRGSQLSQASVHEFVDGQWRQLDRGEVARRIVVTPSIVDSRQ